MIVIVAGMQRSGSTFAYNVVRSFLETRGGVSTFATDTLHELCREKTLTQHAVVKSHSPDEIISGLLRKNGLPCICTIRKPEDAIASWMSVFGFSLEESIVTYKQWLGWHREMHPYMLNIKYEDIDKFPYLVTRNISKYLLRQSNYIESAKICRKNNKKNIFNATNEMKIDGKIDIGFSFYDKDTFYHRRHISSLKSRKASEVISDENLKKIRAELGIYLNSNGVYDW